MKASQSEPRQPNVCTRASDAGGVMDTLFFAVNASLSTLFSMACAISLAAADNPFAFIGGLLFVVPAAIYTIAEWACWYRRRRWLKRSLGIVNLLLAAFFVFGAVTSLGEAAIAEDATDPMFVLVFGIAFTLPAAYFGFCGWRRIHDMPLPAKPDLQPQQSFFP